MATENSIHLLSVVNDSSTDLVTPLSGLSRAVALDYGTELDRVFWTDVNDHAIFQAFVSVSRIENATSLLFQDLGVPDGLAWDWIGQNVFYTDAGLDRIGVVAVFGLYHAPVIAHDLDEPRAIALDPLAG